jgi:hypothetical protein
MDSSRAGFGKVVFGDGDIFGSRVVLGSEIVLGSRGIFSPFL